MSNDIRVFLAHDKSTDDETINKWREQLEDLLRGHFDDEAEVTVVAGRDDFKRRFSDAGGWKGWPKSVVEGKTWDGQALFHLIVRPDRIVEGQQIICGHATFDMMNGFLSNNKQAWVWDPGYDRIEKLARCVQLGDDSWQRCGVLELGDA